MERPVTVIPLAGPLAEPGAEVSGLAWYGDNLILLPQYPSFAGGPGDGVLFALAKADLLAHLDGTGSGSLEPKPIPFSAPGLAREINGFEGYEAIAFLDDQVFVTIEARAGAETRAYLVGGTIAPDLSALALDPGTRPVIEPQAALSNMSDEALFVAGDRLVTIYETNGPAVNASPVAHLFDLALDPLGPIGFPNIEYRITDATSLDAGGRFWAINYFYPGDQKLQPGEDPLAERFGQGATHEQAEQVERLVEFVYDGTAISLTGSPPLQLELAPEARNWEGLVRLDDCGFLIVTDKFPETILGFVPLSE